MAKRKRLTPAQILAHPDHLGPAPVLDAKPWFLAGSPPPIAQISGEASAMSALAEVTSELSAARAEGRMLLRLPLAAIDADHLVRDRLDVTDQDEMAALMESLRAHGQRTPIEVTQIGPGQYGLISGWRRITALAGLQAETGEARFGQVLAQLRRPDTAGDAYVAMVEENEIRQGLSYFERARIVAKAVEQGAFASDKAALQRLFATASRAKRSKIGSFLVLYRDLGTHLRFAAALPERLGLALVQSIESEAGRAEMLRHALAAFPARSAEAELAHLAALIAKKALIPPIEPVFSNPDREIRAGIFLKLEGPALTLSGPNVDDGFRARLEDWIKGG